MTTVHTTASSAWHLSIDETRIATLTLNVAGASTNTLSQERMRALGVLLTDLLVQKPRGLIIQSSKPAGFIAGADINEFAQFNSREGILKLVKSGWDLMNQVAALPFPTLALIDGHCLGGGLELALACRYRVVTDSANTRLGLPEVRLGIVPAWGGMSRLPPLIGAPRALQMMLSGQLIDGRRAYKEGLATACVPLRVGLLTARALIQTLPRQVSPALGFSQKFLNHLSNTVLKPLVARQARASTAKKAARAHYPAPYALIDIWAKYGGNALLNTAHTYSIVDSPTALHLQRVFHLQERLKSIAKNSSVPVLLVQQVHVIGAGVMGGDIAIACAHVGLRVSLMDTDPLKIAAVIERAQKFFSKKLKHPLRVRAAMDRLIPDPMGRGLAHADVVIEAIIENLAIKHALFADIVPKMKPQAILASNTSSLRLEEMASVLPHPERLIGIHFFNPVALMPLVEIVLTPKTDANVVLNACAFVRQLDKLPLPVKSSPGFLVNAVLGPYMLAAMRALDSGTSVAEIDTAMRDFGMPMGPIELIDMVGLDVALAAGSALSGEVLSGDALPNSLAMTPPECLRARVAAGHLGRKTGQGFYVWNKGRAQRGAPMRSANSAKIQAHLCQVLTQMTQKQVDSGVVADADLADAGLIFGAGFAPYTGGPLHWHTGGAKLQPTHTHTNTHTA